MLISGMYPGTRPCRALCVISKTLTKLIPCTCDVVIFKEYIQGLVVWIDIMVTGREGNSMFCYSETVMKHRRSRDHKTYCFPEGPVNKCFNNISSVKVNDSIKNTKTVFIEQNVTK